jgi:hypothetical protein
MYEIAIFLYLRNQEFKKKIIFHRKCPQTNFKKEFLGIMRFLFTSGTYSSRRFLKIFLLLEFLTYCSESKLENNMNKIKETNPRLIPAKNAS